MNKLLPISSNGNFSSHLKKYSHVSQFTKHLSSMKLKGNAIPHIQKRWDAILYDFYQSLSTNKSWPEWKYFKAENHNISSLILSPDTHTKFSTEKENYEVL